MLSWTVTIGISGGPSAIRLIGIGEDIVAKVGTCDSAGTSLTSQPVRDMQWHRSSKSEANKLADIIRQLQIPEVTSVEVIEEEEEPADSDFKD